MDYVKAKAIKLLEENGVNLCHLGVDSAFLAMHHQSLKRKKKVNWLPQNKNLCASENTILWIVRKDM